MTTPPRPPTTALAETGPDFHRECGGAGPIRAVFSRQGETDYFVDVERQPWVIIGSHPEADVHLPAEAVAEKQLFVQLLDGRLFAVSLSTEQPVRWRGKPRTSGWLAWGDPIEFGEYTFRFLPVDQSWLGLAPDLPATDPMESKTYRGAELTLEMLRNGRPAASGKVKRALTLAGHSTLCKVRLPVSVDPLHCAIVGTGHRFWVIDLASHGGVYLNDVARHVALLQEGDVLCIGDVPLLVSRIEPPARPTKPEPTPPAKQPGPTPSLNGSADHKAIEAALAPLVQQFSQSQSETLDQVHQMFGALIQTIGAMLDEHRKAVRDEVRRLTGLAQATAAIPYAAPAAVEPPPPSDVADTPVPADASAA